MVQWYYLILISSLFAGFAAIVEKYTLKKEHATAYSAAFAFLIALMSIAFIPFAKFNIIIVAVLLIYAFSLISTLTYLVTERVLRHSPISTSSPILSVLPTAFIVVLAFLFLGEKLSLVQYMSVGVIVVAAYALFFWTPQTKNALRGPERNKYLLLLFFNSFVLGVSYLINKYLLYTINPYTFLILTEFFVALNFIVIITLRYNGIKEMLATTKRYKYPITAIAVLTTASRIIFYVALVSHPISAVQPLSNALYVITAVAIGGIIFNEGSIKEKLAISLIMVAFSALLIIA